MPNQRKGVPNQKKDVSAMAFLNRARDFQDAANELFLVSERRPRVGRQRALSDPIGFLYFRTVELALKAFLRSRGRPIKKTHEITELHKECRRLGLTSARMIASRLRTS